MRAAFLCIAAGLAVAGCLTPGTYEQASQYAIDTQLDIAPSSVSAFGIGLRALDFAEPYKQAMVYRDDPYSVSFRSAEKWAELPRDTATRMLKDALGASGYFADVGDAADMQMPNYILTGEIRRFDELRYGERRAFCEIRIEVRSKFERDAIWKKTYSREEAMRDTSASAFAEAMSVALAGIIETATQDIITQLDSRETPEFKAP